MAREIKDRIDIVITKMPDERTLGDFLASGPAKVIFDRNAGEFQRVRSVEDNSVRVTKIPARKTLEAFLRGSHRPPTVGFNLDEGKFERLR